MDSAESPGHGSFNSEPWTLPSHPDTEFDEILNNLIRIVNMDFYLCIYLICLIKKIYMFSKP